MIHKCFVQFIADEPLNDLFEEGLIVTIDKEIELVADLLVVHFKLFLIGVIFPA